MIFLSNVLFNSTHDRWKTVAIGFVVNLAPTQVRNLERMAGKERNGHGREPEADPNLVTSGRQVARDEKLVVSEVAAAER
jgi:hypothetical protein